MARHTIVFNTPENPVLYDETIKMFKYKITQSVQHNIKQ